MTRKKKVASGKGVDYKYHRQTKSGRGKTKMKSFPGGLKIESLLRSQCKRMGGEFDVTPKTHRRGARKFRYSCYTPSHSHTVIVEHRFGRNKKK